MVALNTFFFFRSGDNMLCGFILYLKKISPISEIKHCFFFSGVPIFSHELDKTSLLKSLHFYACVAEAKLI